MKKKLMLVSVLILSLVFSSYGATRTTRTSTSRTRQLTVAQYKEEVLEILTEIKRLEAMTSSVSPGDIASTLEIYEEIIPKLTPLYERLGSLNAPASLSRAQAKLKDGADASLGLFKLSLEMFEILSNPPSDTSIQTRKMQELQKQTNEFRSKELDMGDAIEEIMDAN